MPEYYSNVVTSQNAASTIFGEFDKFKLELDLTDFWNNITYKSTDLTYSFKLKIENVEYQTPDDIVHLDGNDIEFSYYNGSEYINMLSLSNPGVSVSVSSPTSGTWANDGGPGSDKSGVIYDVVYTIDSAIDTSSLEDYNWLSTVAGLPGDISEGGNTFKLEPASSMRTKFESKGYEFWPFTFSGIYAFEVTLGTIPEVTIVNQPVNTPFDNVSTFEVRWAKWTTQTLDPTNTGWQYSDDYDPNNPTLATWQSINGLSGASEAGSTQSSSVGIDRWFPEGSEHPQSFQNGGPNIDDFTNSLTISQWKGFRYFRFKISAS